MITFLRIMISIWVCGITISILSRYYASAILCFVFLLNTISELWHEKEYEAIEKSIENTKEYIEKCGVFKKVRRDSLIKVEHKEEE